MDKPIKKLAKVVDKTGDDLMIELVLSTKYSVLIYKP